MILTERDGRLFCSQCALMLSGDVALCPHHVWAPDGWAESNRAFCSFIHRGEIRSAPPMTDVDFAAFVRGVIA